MISRGILIYIEYSEFRVKGTSRWWHMSVKGCSFLCHSEFPALKSARCELIDTNHRVTISLTTWLTASWVLWRVFYPILDCNTHGPLRTTSPFKFQAMNNISERFLITTKLIILYNGVKTVNMKMQLQSNTHSCSTLEHL